MKHKGDIDHLANRLEALDVQLGLGRLHGVDRADSGGQRVAAGALYKIHGLIGIGHSGLDFFLGDAVGRLQHPPQLGLHGNPTYMSDVYNARGNGHILLVGPLGTIVHERRKAGAQTTDVLIKVGAVIEVQHHGHVGLGGGHLDQRGSEF